MFYFIVFTSLFKFTASSSFVCNSLNVSSTLPVLPKSYSVMSEVKNLISNQTYVMKEHNDFKANKRAIDYSLLEDNQLKKYKKLYDYNADEERDIEIVGNTIKCTTVSMSTAILANRHAPSMSDVLHVGTQYGNGRYINGTELVRDIRCRHWQQCVNNKNESYMIDYYFTADREQTPVRRVLKGIGKDKKEIYIVSDYFDLRIRTPPSSVFEAPLGILCKYEYMIPIPRIPNIIKYSTEYNAQIPASIINGKKQNFILNGKVYYDYPHGLFRSDHHIQEDGNFLAVKEIHHIDLKSKILIYSPYTCKITPLETTPKALNPHDNRQHQIYMKTTIELFKLNREKVRYEGVTSVRGIMADVFILKVDVKNVDNLTRIEWYFSQSSSKYISTRTNIQQEHVLLKVSGYANNDSIPIYTLNIYNFDHQQNDESILNPARHCLELGESLYVITFILTGLPKENMYALHNQTELVNILLDVFATYAKVKQSRLSIELVKTEKQIDVRLSIYGWPFKTTTPPKDFIPAKTISSRIKNGVLSGGIVIVYHDVYNNKNYTAKFQKKFFDGVTLQFSKLDAKTKSEHSNQHTVGWILTGVFCFLFGLIVMFAFIHLSLSKNGISLRKSLNLYRHFDDNTNKNDDPRHNGTEMDHVST